MKYFLISFVVFLIAVGFMAIGAILQGKCIQGSCGGLNRLFGGGACDVCDEKDKLKKPESFEV